MKRIINEELFIAGWDHADGEEVFAKMRIGDTIDLVREPENKFDSNAIAVYWCGQGMQPKVKIGYIPRTSNGALALMMDGNYLGGDDKIKATIIKREISSNPWKRLAIKIEVEL